MVTPVDRFVWRATGFSQKGAKHSRIGDVCQDAIHWLPENGIGSPIVLSIADGHGDSRYFRSGIGAQLAVQSVESVLFRLLDETRRHERLFAIPQINRYVEYDLGRDIIKQWNKAVRQHVHETPLSTSEILQLKNQSSKVSQVDKFSLSEEELVLTYGSTILSVLITSSFIIYIQLGDGDIVTIGRDGTIDRPIKSRKQLGDSTESLGQAKISDFQAKLQVIEEGINPPPLILISTDGFANSYRSDEDFYKFGKNLFNMLVESSFVESFKSIGINLPMWLNEITTKGSGDDVTLGILCEETFFGGKKKASFNKVMILPAIPPE